MADSAPARPRRAQPTPWQVVELAAISSYAPLVVWAASTEGASLLVSVLFALAVFLLAVASHRMLIWVGLDTDSTVNAVASFYFFLSICGSLIDRFPLGRAALFVLAALIAVILYRLTGMRVVDFLVTWIVFALLALPWVGLIERIVQDDDPGTLHPSSDFYHVTETADVVVVVFDGYASTETLNSVFGFDNSTINARLSELGFTVSPGILANYSHTTLSIPSILEMSYPATDGLVTGSDVDSLQMMLGGDNRFSRSLQRSGYNTVYVESGWLGTRCAEVVDVCVRAQWPGETFHDIIHRTVLRDAPGLETGRLFSDGAARAIAWSETELPRYLSNGTPDYIYLHLLLPHPPFFFDSSCDRYVDTALGGFTLSWPGISDQQLISRKTGYVEQLKCANRVIEALAELAAESGSALVMFGDHGSDTQNQLFLAVDMWDQARIEERLRTFSAIRVPGCEVDQPSSLVQIGPAVLSCLGAEVLPEPDDRVFVVDRIGGDVHVKEIPTIE